jgi:hypothetical protein
MSQVSRTGGGGDASGESDKEEEEMRQVSWTGRRRR